MNLVQPADRAMRSGIEEATKAKAAFRQSKTHMLNAGYFFLTAREELKHGDFGDYVETFAEAIARRTVYKYIEFAQMMLAAAEAEHGPKSREKLLDLARDMELPSPRAHTEVWRASGEMKQFGEYDGVKYRANQIAPRQIEFQFAFEDTIEQLTALKRDERVATLAPASLKKLEGELEASLAHVREILNKEGREA